MKIINIIFLLFVSLNVFSQKLPEEFFADIWVIDLKKCEQISEAFEVEGGFYIGRNDNNYLISGYGFYYDIFSIKIKEDGFYELECVGFLNGNPVNKFIQLKTNKEKLIFKENESVVEYVKCK
jgi:hypothetical protein